MKREIIRSKKFSKELHSLLAKNKLLVEDFDDFEKILLKNPEIGDLIPGTGGIRKIRLKSSTSGKSSGFRICYYYFIKDEQIFLLLIYAKNVQENLTLEQKKFLKEVINEIKKN